VDVLGFTGHKALMGSMGIGGLCVRKHVQIRHTRAGGTGVNSVYPYHLDEYPWRMEYGTPNMVGVAALWAGQEWIAEQGGVEAIHQREMKLARKLIDGLREIEGVRIYCWDKPDNHLSTVTINIDGAEAGDVGTMLDVDHEIAVRTGLHCAPLVHTQLGTLEMNGGVRFSIGAFNTEAHIDAALNGVRVIAAWAAGRKSKPKAAAAGAGK
jgi:selenocysteine lyase/cysteine desulfurase